MLNLLKGFTTMSRIKRKLMMRVWRGVWENVEKFQSNQSGLSALCEIDKFKVDHNSRVLTTQHNFVL